MTYKNHRLQPSFQFRGSQNPHGQSHPPAVWGPARRDWGGKRPGTGGGPGPGAGKCGRQPHVFRDRPGKRPVRQCPSRRGPTDPGDPGLRCGPKILSPAGQHRGGIYRPGISFQRQADHPGRPGGSFLRQAPGPAHGAAISATPTTPRPTRTIWTCF